MQRDDNQIELLRQKHAETVKRIRELHQQRAESVRDETERRTENRDDFSGSFSTTSTRRLDSSHPSNRHRSSERVEKINEVIDAVTRTDQYRKLTGEIIVASRELDKVWEKVEELLVDDDETKKNNIGAIWSVLGTDVDKRRLVDAVDCHRQYPNRLTLNEETGRVEYKDRVKRRKQNQVRPDHRKEILARDGHKCVRCGHTDEDDLLIHHITPVSHGGTADDENLSTLCEDCHDEAHNFSSTGEVVYGDKRGFRAWIQGANRGLESNQERITDY